MKEAKRSTLELVGWEKGKKKEKKRANEGGEKRDVKKLGLEETAREEKRGNKRKGLKFIQ